MTRPIRLVSDSGTPDPLSELTARVEALESLLVGGERALARPGDPASDAPIGTGGAAAGALDDPLWMLTGLADRYPADAVVGYVGRIPAPAPDGRPTPADTDDAGSAGTGTDTDTDATSNSTVSTEYRGPAPVSWQYGLGVADVLHPEWDGREVAARLAALSNPTRLRLVQEILRGRETVAALSEVNGVGTTGQVYHHLTQLQAAGWVRQVARGRYGVPADRVVPLLVIVLATGGVS